VHRIFPIDRQASEFRFNFGLQPDAGKRSGKFGLLLDIGWDKLAGNSAGHPGNRHREHM
jgi:hypothetical protein